MNSSFFGCWSCISDPHGEHVPTRITVSLPLYRTSAGSSQVRSGQVRSSVQDTVVSDPLLSSPSTCVPPHPRVDRHLAATDTRLKGTRHKRNTTASSSHYHATFLPELYSYLSHFNFFPRSTSLRKHRDWHSSTATWR